MTTLILAYLNEADYERIYCFPYVETGPIALPDDHGVYVATTVDHLEQAVEALGWERFKVHIDNGNWIVRERRDK